MTETGPSARAEALLSERFGFDAFRPGQADVVAASEAGRDVLFVAPTGSGKSLAYWIPGLTVEGLTIVVSPLIALMTDQVARLRELGIPAECIHSGMDPARQEGAMEAAWSGSCRFLYIAPERFAVRSFARSLGGLSVSRFVIDEAHCISTWGHDFRPDYRRLGAAIETCGRPPVGAFTATATPRVRDDIAASLGLRDPVVRVTGFVRENLTMAVRRTPGEAAKLAELDRAVTSRTERVIVYCGRIRGTEAIAEHLRQRGIAAAAYHGSLQPEDRARVHRDFAEGRTRVIAATSAFGMGVDYHDIRQVIHFDFPGSLESYYQEAGRAGRDGLPSRCILLYSPADRDLHEYFIERAFDEADPASDRETLREHAYARVHQVMDYARSRGCRHARIADYFGEEGVARTCRACDNCLSPAREMRAVATRQVEAALRCVARFSGFLGAARVASILRGADDSWTRDKSWVKDLDFFGSLRDWPAERVRDLLSELVEEGAIARTPGERPTLQVRPLGRDVISGSAELQIELPVSSAPAPRTSAEPAALDPGAAQRFDRLRAWRTEVARSERIPPYMVFSDRTLVAIAANQPQDATELAAISGVGPAKLERYGAAVLERVRVAVSRPPV